MMRVVLHQFPGAQVEYRFKCRNPGVQLAPLGESGTRSAPLCTCIFRMRSWPICVAAVHQSDFVDFLGLFRLNESTSVTPPAQGRIDRYPRAPGCTILFQIRCWPSSMRWFSATQRCPTSPKAASRLDAKIAALQTDGLGDLKIADYGTTAAFRAWHEECCACW